MINPTFFFRYLKGRCHGNEFRGKNGAKLPTPCTYRLIALSIQIEIRYRDLSVRVNSANDASIPCKNFVNFGPVTPERGSFVYFFMTWQKTGIFSQISQEILDWFSQSFYHMKALWVQMIDLYLVFRFVEGRCHSNQLILVKCHERRLIPLAFFALSFENELQYHCQNVHVNSGDDVAISCKNLVNFCQETPEIMELIWERQVRHGQKTGVFRWISQDILDGFSQYFYHMKVL